MLLMLCFPCSLSSAFHIFSCLQASSFYSISVRQVEEQNLYTA